MAKLTFDQTVADFRTLLAWQTAGRIAEAIGKKLTAAPATPDKPHVNLERAEPTAADKRRAYKNDVVFHSKKLGKYLTKYDIDQLLADQYAMIIKEGYTADGELLQHLPSVSNSIISRVPECLPCRSCKLCQSRSKLSGQRPRSRHCRSGLDPASAPGFFSSTSR